jgi:pimeloyl-ACP methyl ester carboxylesterase
VDSTIDRERAAALSTISLVSRGFAHEAGVVHTPAVDIGYETFGARGDAVPVIAVNGGPGLSHAYMLVNDMWLKIAKHRLMVFYDQRGTGASKRLQPGARQPAQPFQDDLLFADQAGAIHGPYGRSGV